jgi:glycosyltransferase involved in cell wall biosynthesis
VQNGRIILCTWQPEVLQHGLPFPSAPWVWAHLPISKKEVSFLEQNAIDGILVVSDTVRLPFLHSRAHKRIGRVYNPLNPFFDHSADNGEERYHRPNVVFAGYIGESKGVHRLLQMWSHVRQRIPKARLTIAGSYKLYDEQRETGSFGIAHPEFEANYIAPLTARFGSIDGAGIEFVGLKSATELRELYWNSALGVVNPNWSDYTETFCCTAIEMLATGLPVFSCAAGALPETIGRSGGAILAGTPCIARLGEEFAKLLVNGPRLSQLGAKGQQYVASLYNREAVLDCWERLLQVPASQLHRATGPWRGPRGLRYWSERGVGVVGLGKPYRSAVELIKKAAYRRVNSAH